jgi:hypothetical protein
MSDMFNTGSEDHIDPSKDYHTELVGEGKKFANDAELALAKVHSDAHIAKLEAENAQYRLDLQQSKTVEELMETIRNAPQSGHQDPPRGSENATEKDAANRVSRDDVVKLLEQKIAESKTADTRASNAEYVTNELKRVYGPNFQSKVADMAAGLGMNTAEMSQLAMERPKAFLKLVSGDQRSSAQPPFLPPTKVNTAATFQGTPAKTWAWYQGLKERDPQAYKSPQIQLEMHHEAQSQGAAFFGRED